jgi:hypothetical protein
VRGVASSLPLERQSAFNREIDMPSKSKLALCAAIVLGSAIAASAAPRHHEAGRDGRAVFNVVPNSDSHVCPPTCSNFCPATGPCRINSDQW